MQQQFEGSDNKAQMSEASGNYSRAASDRGNRVCIIVQLGHIMPMTFINTYMYEAIQSCAWAEITCIMLSTVGTEDVRGYDGQLKCTVCDACRLCHSILKPVLRQIRHIRCVYNLLRCLDLHIWWFCVHDNNNDDTTDYFTPCACTHDNNNYRDMWVIKFSSMVTRFTAFNECWLFSGYK